MLAMVACLGALVPSGARADGPPIVVVLEADRVPIRPARFRRSLSEELGVPTVSLVGLEGGEARGTLTVAVARRGRGAAASVHFVPADAPEHAVLIEVETEDEADPSGEWLVMPAAAAIRTADERREAVRFGREVLDPWLEARVRYSSDERAETPIPLEVLDPFAGEAPRAIRVDVDGYYLGPDVLDPWEELRAPQREERGEGLSTPHR